MKVLWHSNAPWAATGYGQQTALTVPRINAAGHPTAISALYGLNGGILEIDGVTHYPGGADAYGNDVVAAHALHWFENDRNAGWIVILMDAWVFQAPSIGKMHTALWCPIDHDPAPPEVIRFFRQFDAMPIAMSKFGVERFAWADIEAMYVPHGIDTNIFRPGLRSDVRAAWQQEMGIPADAFVVGMNAANKAGDLHRKGYPQAFEAFAAFANKRDDAFMYLHTEATGRFRGWDLESLVATYDLTDRVRFVPQYEYVTGLIAPETMAMTYNAFDVLLNPSLGEGFGIPIIEAQACGVPVIVTNHTAMPELVGDGWVVDGDLLPHQSMGFTRWKNPSVAAIYEALSDAYDRRSDKPSQQARDKAVEYDVDTVFANHWLPVLENMAERINPQAVAA